MTRLSTRFGLPAVLAALTLALALLASSSPRVASAAFVTPPVFSAPIQAAGLTETWTIGGWQGSLSNHITSATVAFPAGFVVPASPVVTLTAGGAACTVLRAITTNQTVTLEIVGACATSGAPPQQVITIAGITSPSTPSTHPAAGFTLSTSVDGTLAASNNVVTWGLTTGPVMCTQVAGQSAGEIRFTAAPSEVVGNTGSGFSAPLSVSINYGAFAITPYVVGTLGVPQAASGLTVAPSTIAGSISTDATLVVDVMAPGSSITSVVTLRIVPATGGTSILLASAAATFADGECVPPAATPAPNTPPAPTGGAFSGGTIAASGVSIVSFTGTTAQLSTAGAASKVVTVTATVGGKSLTFVVGAPDFANAEFNAAFPSGLSGALVIVKT